MDDEEEEFAEIEIENIKNNRGRSNKSDKNDAKHKLYLMNEFQPIDFTLDRNENLLEESSTGEEVSISGFWTKENQINLPKRISVLVAGVPVKKVDTLIEGGKKVFFKILKEKSDKLFSKSIKDGYIFGTLKEALEFSKKITSGLTKHINMSNMDFFQVNINSYKFYQHLSPI